MRHRAAAADALAGSLAAANKSASNGPQSPVCIAASMAAYNMLLVVVCRHERVRLLAAAVIVFHRSKRTRAAAAAGWLAR